MIDLNCVSVTKLTHPFTGRFAQRGSGGVILFSSIVGMQGMPNSAVYAATKGYVQCFGEAIAVELAEQNVDVLRVAPGPTRSGFADRAGRNAPMFAAPEQVVVPALRSLGSRRTLLPGWLAKLLAIPITTLPRFARVRTMGVIGRRMIACQSPHQSN